MIETRIRAYQSLIRIIDVLSSITAFVACIALFSAWPILPSDSGLFVLNIRLFAVIVFALLFIILLHLGYFAFFGLRHGIYDLSSLRKHFLRSIFVLLLDCLIIYLLQRAVVSVRFPPWFYLSYFALSLLQNIVLNYLFKYVILRLIRKRSAKINLLIVGTNQHAYGFYKLIMSNKFLGYNVLGFLDEANYGGYSIDIIARLDDFQRIVRENVIDRGVVFLPIRSYHDQIINIIDVAENQGIALQLMNNIFESKHGYISSTRMGDYSGVLFDVMPLDDWRLMVKRIFDLAFALLLLVIFSPFLLAAAAAIKLEDGGPIFYKQKRIGFHKRVFTLYKLRTMVVGADRMQHKLEDLNEMDGAVFKIRDDPRISKTGKYLRKYGIDELPQLFNVIMGDMSVVGPRPLAERDYSKFSEDWLRRRFSVRPGVTCYWQCMLNRNDVPFTEWMNLDMKYINNWNLLTDIKIIVKTIPVMLSGTGR